MASNWDASELRTLGASLEKSSAQTGRLVQTVVRKTARDITADAKRLAPVDTGNLRGSIGHSDLRTVGTTGNAEVEIGPTANYGVFLELGTSRMAPQPFMGPAADRHAGAFTEALAQVAEQAAGGG